MPRLLSDFGDIVPTCHANLSSSNLLSLLSRYAQNTAICSLRPHGTNILPHAHLISMEVLNTVMRMSDSIALGHSCLIESSIVLYCRESSTAADGPIVFAIVASYSRDHAPSWRQTSSVLCINGSEAAHML